MRLQMKDVLFAEPNLPIVIRAMFVSPRRPVFRPFDENWLFTTNAISPFAVEPIRARILADGIPATSFAAGANPLPPSAVLADLNYATFRSADWPRRDRSWRQSDIKKVAFFFTQGFFKRIVEGDNR